MTTVNRPPDSSVRPEPRAGKPAPVIPPAGAGVHSYLAAGDTRGALHDACHALTAAAARLRRTDPARAALVDAWLAGSIAATAETLTTRRVPSPPGYTSGPPSAADLLATCEQARAATLT